MVRLIPGPVARCVPIGAQHATNGHFAQQRTQHPAQQNKRIPYETVGGDAQQGAQRSRNNRATNDPVSKVEKLRVSLAVREGEPVGSWRVTTPAGASIEVLFTPPATREQVAEVYPGATIEPLSEGEFSEQSTHAREQSANPDVERRRARALAILAERPELRIAIVAEPGEPAHVAIGIRGIAVGELEIPAERYDAFALLALMQQYGNA